MNGRNGAEHEPSSARQLFPLAGLDNAALRINTRNTRCVIALSLLILLGAASVAYGQESSGAGAVRLLLDEDTGLSWNPLEGETGAGVVYWGDPDPVVQIDASPAMPSLALQLDEVCGTIYWNLNIEWDGPGSLTTYNTIDDQEFDCDDGLEPINWSEFDNIHTAPFEGGTAYVQWYYCPPSGEGSCTDPQLLYFTIEGDNPSSSAVDAYIPSAPWFWENIMAEESGAHVKTPTGVYHQFYNNYPLDSANPQGIGITQLDYSSSGTQPYDDDFWDWQVNEYDGYYGTLGGLLPKKTGAYNHWNQQLTNYIADGASPSVPSTYGTYCAFQYPQGGGDYYGDADWMHAYNGFYFTEWIRPSGGNPGSWNMDGYNHSGYVQNVCNNAPL
jgi:hypothetical protein